MGMQIYITPNFTKTNFTQPNFTGNSKVFRRDCVERVRTGNFTDTQKGNIEGLTKQFDFVNLTYQQCRNAAKVNPFMLVQKPETMARNIIGCAEALSQYGVTVSGHLQNALRCPPLFSMSPATIEGNLTEIARTFADEGLTMEEVVKMAKSQPNMYTLNPRSLEKKVNEIAEGIGGTRADVLEIFKTRPTTCSLDAKEIIKKFKFLRYIEQNKYFDLGKQIPADADLKKILLKKIFTNSMETNYLILLRNKISSTLPVGSKLPFDHLRQAVADFLKFTESSSIDLRLPIDKQAGAFVEFAENFSKSAIGKNLFNFKMV